MTSSVRAAGGRDEDEGRKQRLATADFDAPAGRSSRQAQRSSPGFFLLGLSSRRLAGRPRPESRRDLRNKLASWSDRLIPRNARTKATCRQKVQCRPGIVLPPSDHSAYGKPWLECFGCEGRSGVPLRSCSGLSSARLASQDGPSLWIEFSDRV